MKHMTTATTPIVVDPSGEGDEKTLAEALLRAPDGGAVELSAGEHTHHGTTTLQRSVSIRGAGADATTVRGQSDGGWFIVPSGVELSLGSLTLDRVGGGESDVVTVQGKLDASSCRLRGGRDKGGAVRLCDDGFATLDDCELLHCAVTGFAATDRGRFRLRGCLMSNSPLGAMVFDQADGALVQCRCVDNQLDGLRVFGAAHLTLERCEFSRHGERGIIASGSAALTVQGCRCHDNGGSGVHFLDDASGSVSGLETSGNGGFGVRVDLPARVEISDHTSEGDRRGATFDGAAVYGAPGPGVRPTRPVRSLQRELDALQKELEAHDEVTAAALRSGADAETLARLATVLEDGVPLDLEAWFCWHDGQEDEDDAELSLEWAAELLSVEQAMESWNFQQEEHAAGELLEPWRPTWVPILRKYTDVDFLVVETEGQQAGAVISYWHDDPQRRVEYESLAHFAQCVRLEREHARQRTSAEVRFPSGLDPEDQVPVPDPSLELLSRLPAGAAFLRGPYPLIPGDDWYSVYVKLGDDLWVGAHGKDTLAATVEKARSLVEQTPRKEWQRDDANTLGGLVGKKEPLGFLLA